jgi:cytidylate kinase
MYRVLTISREFGSGGIHVARRVAEHMSWRLLDSELIETIVERANVDPAVARRYDERVDAWLHRVSQKALWLGAIEGVSNARPEVFDAATMATLTQRVILESAAIGNCVIVGRGAQCLLAGREEALHVFLCAPRAWRLNYLRRKLESKSDLEHAMDATDHQRADYIRMHYGHDMYDRNLYDIILNTRRGIDRTVQTIVRELQAQE